MKQGLLLGVLVLSFGSVSAWAAGNLGLGVIIGNPTGISGKHNLTKRHAIDAAAGWSFRENRNLHLHGDYLWLFPGVMRLDGTSTPYDLYTGLGARLITWKSGKNEHDMVLGARVPGGIGFKFARQSIEFFVEVALTMDLIPETGADLDAALGGRFYF